MVHRMVGVAGFFLFYAYFSSSKPRSPQLRRMAEIIVAIYLMCAMYMSIESPDDRMAFSKLVPGGSYALYIYALMMGVCMLCYLPGMYVHDVTQALVIVVALSTIFVDSNIKFWTRKKGMDFWNQIRLISDNLAIITGLLIYLTCTKKQTYGEPPREHQD